MAGFRFPNKIRDVARLFPEMETPANRQVGRWEQMIALLERDFGDLEDFLNHLPTGGGGKDWNTVVVAASDSHAGATADFVCDGVDDQDTLIAAIQTFPSIAGIFGFSGGRLVLLEGTYYFSAALSMPSGLSVVEIVGGIGTPINSTVITTPPDAGDIPYLIDGLHGGGLTAVFSISSAEIFPGNAGANIGGTRWASVSKCLVQSSGTASTIAGGGEVVDSSVTALGTGLVLDGNAGDFFSRAVIRNTDLAGAGANLVSLVGGTVDIDGVTATYSGSGVAWELDLAGTPLRFRDSRLVDSFSGQQLHVKNAARGYLHNVEIDYTGSGADIVVIEDSTEVRISSNTIRGTFSADGVNTPLVLAGTTQKSAVIGNFFGDCGSANPKEWVRLDAGTSGNQVGFNLPNDNVTDLGAGNSTARTGGAC